MENEKMKIKSYDIVVRETMQRIESMDTKEEVEARLKKWIKEDIKDDIRIMHKYLHSPLTNDEIMSYIDYYGVLDRENGECLPASMYVNSLDIVE